MKIIHYNHHGRLVAVFAELRGKHREHCLCFRCAFFHPDESGNCPIAQELYEFDVEYGCTTPMWECHTFKEKKT